MVKEISSLAEFEAAVKGPGLVVVDFFTVWCGPCKKIAPFMESLGIKYPDVKFIKVDIEKNEDIAAPRHIKSIPTFHFFVKGSLVDEMKGANEATLEQKVIQHKVDVNPFAGQGHKLAAAADVVPALSAREARLKAFAAVEGEKKPSPSSSSSSSSASASAATPATAAAPAIPPAGETEEDEEEALAKAMALSMAAAASAPPASTSSASASGSGSGPAPAKGPTTEASDLADAIAEQDARDQAAHDQEWGDEMVPVPVNAEILAQMVDMGFSDVQARKSIVHGGSLEGALGWIADHQDDPDIDQPYMVKKSETIPKKELTPEEKKARMEDIKNRVQARRQERAKQEKADAIRIEKERRERGQKIDETLEERQKMQRKRDNEKIKREKMEVQRERERLRAEIARDKEARKANKGVLPSVLGVDGYNPSIVQYDQPMQDGAAAPGPDASATAAAGVESSIPAKRATASSSSNNNNSSSGGGGGAGGDGAAAKKPAASKPVTASAAAAAAAFEAMEPAKKVESLIQTIMRYRTGKDGGNALKLLHTFVKNIAENPEEIKYRSINMESNAFKSKLAPLFGTVQLLKVVGFEKNEAEGKLQYAGELQTKLLRSTTEKLAQAEALYKQLNP